MVGHPIRRYRPGVGPLPTSPNTRKSAAFFVLGQRSVVKARPRRPAPIAQDVAQRGVAIHEWVNATARSGDLDGAWAQIAPDVSWPRLI
jgi:hypothetical protein